MSKPRVFVSREIFPEALREIEAETDAELWRDEMPPPRDVLLDKVRGVDGLLCLLTDGVDAELMDAAGPQLKVVSQIAVGFDNIDIPEATRRGIAVGNTPDVLTQTTADATFTLMLAAARKVVEASRAVQEGRWRTWHPLHFLGQDVYGATWASSEWAASGSRSPDAAAASTWRFCTPTSCGARTSKPCCR